MAIKLVQFEDKQNINEKPELPRINKVIDADMNELKYVANMNANNVGNLENLNTTDKSSLVNAINSISEIITNEKGTAIKYSNGILECFGEVSGNPFAGKNNFANGNLSRTNTIEFQDFPVKFLEVPYVDFSVKYADQPTFILKFNGFYQSTTNPGRCCLVNDNSSKNINGTVQYHAIGKWK